MKLFNLPYIIFGVFTILLTSCEENSTYGRLPSLESRILEIGHQTTNKLEFRVTDNGIISEYFQNGFCGRVYNGSIRSNVSWSFTNVPSWVRINPERGKGDSDFSLEVSQNESIESRTDTIYLSTNFPDWNINREVIIEQSGADPYLEVQGYEGNWMNISSSRDFSYQIDSNFDDIIIKEIPAWISAHYNNTTKAFSISLTENKTGNSRFGKVMIYGGDDFQKKYYGFIIVQLNDVAVIYNMDCEYGYLPDYFYYTNYSYTEKISVHSDFSWSAKITNGSWLNITPSNGTEGMTDLKVTVKENTSSEERNTGIVFTLNENNETFEIKFSQGKNYSI